MTPLRPNFFIVGAAKAGTTSLWSMLKKHPDICMPMDEMHKEPGYFSPLRRQDDYDSYIRRSFHCTGEERWTGEASTAYLTDPDAPNLIFEHDSNARIIIILRNPADRAYSLYNWMVADGYETAGTFTKALEREPARRNRAIPNRHEPEYTWNYRYVESGMYAEQVRRYLERFAANVLVLKFEDMLDDPLAHYRSACAFLGVTPATDAAAQRENPSPAVYSARLQFILRRSSRWLVRKGVLSNTTKRGRDVLMRLGRKQHAPKPLPLSVRERLINTFRGNIEETAALTGLNLSDWLDPSQGSTNSGHTSRNASAR